MEILAALLTAVSLWVLLAHQNLLRATFPPQRPGAVLMELGQGKWRFPGAGNVLSLIGNALALVVWPALLAFVSYSERESGSSGMTAIFAFVALWGGLHGSNLAAILCRLEVRENGLATRFPAGTVFLPWHEIWQCKWESGGTVLHVHAYLGPGKEYHVPAGQREAVTDILARHIIVRDEEGKRIAAEKLDPWSWKALGTGGPARRFVWPQFTLRTLLLAAIVVGAASSWYALAKQRRAHGAEVAQRLAAAGATAADLSRPAWSLSFDDPGRELSEDDLSVLEEEPRLERLHFYRVRLSDSGLACVARVKTLTHLALIDSPISDAALSQVARMKVLTELDLSKTRITDAGIVHLEGLGNLEKLYLRFTPLTDASVVHLVKLKRLKTLDLQGTKVSPEGIQRLRQALPKTEITLP